VDGRGSPCRSSGVGNRAQPGLWSEVSSERPEGASGQTAWAAPVPEWVDLLPADLNGEVGESLSETWRETHRLAAGDAGDNSADHLPTRLQPATHLPDAGSSSDSHQQAGAELPPIRRRPGRQPTRIRHLIDTVNRSCWEWVQDLLPRVFLISVPPSVKRLRAVTGVARVGPPKALFPVATG